MAAENSKSMVEALALVEALGSQFEEQKDCDVFFYVDGQTVGAHKLILNFRGKGVLEKIPECSLRSPEENPVLIEDLDFNSFKTLLRYTCTGEMLLSNNNVFIFLSAAVHFKMPHLEQLCADHISQSMGTENVCAYMDQAVKFKSTALQEKCRQLFSKQTHTVVHEASFLVQSQPALSALLDTENTNVLEIVLFIKVERWMEQKCKEQNLPVNGTNMRQVIGDALYKIRFPTMNVQDFANVVTTIRGLLTDTEMSQIFQKITVFDQKDIMCLFQTKFRCCYNIYHTPFSNATQLCTEKVLENCTEECDMESMLRRIKNLSQGEIIRVNSLRLLLQCCADLANSSGSMKVADLENQHIRNEIHDDFQAWLNMLNTKNIHDIGMKFLNFRAKFDKLCVWHF